MKPQEALEFKLNKRTNNFSFSPQINLFEEGKKLVAVTSSEAINSVFNLTNENYSFSISLASHWRSDDGEDFINKL